MPNRIAQRNNEWEGGARAALPNGYSNGIQVVLQPLAHLIPVATQEEAKLHGKSKNRTATSQMTWQQICCHSNSTSHTTTASENVFKGHICCQDKSVDDEVLVGRFVKQYTSCV